MTDEKGLLAHIELGLLCIGGLAAVFVAWRYKSGLALRQAVENNNASIQAYKGLLEVKDQEIDELRSELVRIKTDFEFKLSDLSRRVDLLTQENIAYRAAKVAGEERVSHLRELAVWIRSNCPQQCEVAKLVRERIGEVLEQI